MKKYLIFRLYGPMASWGKIAIGESRHSDAYPSKSAIMGLVAAALGIRRTEDAMLQQLVNSCGFGVKVVSTGTFLQDYHTTQVPPAQRNVRHYTRYEELKSSRLGTILSTREYRCDALSIAALWSLTDNMPFSLEQIAEALKYPKFTLYLGRKSCPLSLPVQAFVEQKEDLKSALDSKFEPFEHEYLIPKTTLQYCWDEMDESGMGTGHQQIQRHDMFTSRKRWQFESRTENVYIERGQ